MKQDSKCCAGTVISTPVSTENRPGLSAIRYRIGTYTSFLDTMQARLSSSEFPELAALKTRDAGDPAMALLDAWAVSADVLSFYQERLANEAYLATATERRSVVELARLIGYQPRPGVSASVDLVYEIDANAQELVIPMHARVQSVPGLGEQMQTFETTEPLKARAEWNTLKLRMNQPPRRNGLTILQQGLYFRGTATQLKANDALLVDFGSKGEGLQPYRVSTVEVDTAANRTRVGLRPWVNAATHNTTQEIARHYSATDQTAGDAGLKTAMRRVLAMLKPLTMRISAVLEPLTTRILGVLNPVVMRILAMLKPLSLRILAVLKPPAVRVLAVLKPPVMRVLAVLKPLVARHKATEQFFMGDAGAKTAIRRVQDVLKPLADDQEFGTTVELVTSLQKSLSDLETELSSLPPDSALLRPWIAGMIEEFKFAHESLLDRVMQEASAPVRTAVASTNREGGYKSFIGQLTAPPSVSPRNELRLARDIRATFAAGGEIFQQLLKASQPSLAGSLNGALGNVAVTPAMPITVYVMRVKAALFANNAPSSLVMRVEDKGKVNTKSLNLRIAWRGLVPATNDKKKEEVEAKKGITLIGLDAPYEQIKPDDSGNPDSREGASYALIDRPDLRFTEKNTAGEMNEALTSGRHVTIHKITQINTVAMAAGMSLTGKVTQLGLNEGWLAGSREFDDLLNSELLLRGTQVYAQSERLALADDPIEDNIGNHFSKFSPSVHEIELDGLYDGLRPGRWLIISGQRIDKEGNVTTPGAERVMLAGARHGIKQVGIGEDLAFLAGDKIHTFITLAQPLAYCYKRDTVTIHGNVVRANHGETRRETLGSGDGRQAFQSFSLKQPPLTFVAASSPEGISSTLELRVNGVRWSEVDTLLNLVPSAQGYITRRDDDEKTSVIFGDGKQGARLPTGQENIQAIYRNGIGRVGNVHSLQLSLATDKPLGVKGVSNPIRASGGADRDTRDQARRNAPLAIMALDRLVSVQDYADFARTFAGIGKAIATRVADGHRQLVHVTIAGVDDAPIGHDSDLYRNLVDAFRRNGDPHLPVRVQTRTLRPLLIHAKVAVATEYPWETVAPMIRAALLDTFGFERRKLGQAVLKSSVIAVIQGIPGVLYSVVEIDALTEDQIIAGLGPQGSISPDSTNGRRSATTRAPDVFGLGGMDPRADANIPVALASVSQGQLHPAELVYLLPAVPETLLLELQP